MRACNYGSRKIPGKPPTVLKITIYYFRILKFPLSAIQGRKKCDKFEKYLSRTLFERRYNGTINACAFVTCRKTRKKQFQLFYRSRIQNLILSEVCMNVKFLLRIIQESNFVLQKRGNILNLQLLLLLVLPHRKIFISYLPTISC